MPCAVILTALPAEYCAVRAHLSDLHEEVHPQNTIYEWGQFKGGGQTWNIGIVEIGVGNPRVAIEAERAIAHFQPEVILFVGVAGGIKDVDIGDVVVSTKVYGYEFGKAEATFKPRPEIGLPAYRLEQRARAEARKFAWVSRLATSPKENPRVWVAPIAAGEKVVTSMQSHVCQFLRSHYEDAIAVEMEGLGFLEAARGNQGVDAIVIRGISNLINDKVDQDQARSLEIAARHASAFAFELLAKLEPKAGNILLSQATQDNLPGQWIPRPRCRQVFGREDLTETVLHDLQQPQAAPILCLGGVAGYGKTEAATCVAKAAIARSVVDDVLWVSIRESELLETFITANSGNELVQWQEVLYQLSRQLDCPADRESVQKCLRKRKWLVVLDNAETANLQDILPKLVKMLEPSRALLTSRVNTPLAFVHVIDCPGLSEHWSQQLLQDEAEYRRIHALLDASESQRHRLYELSCGAPLALHFIVGRVCDDEAIDPVLDALEAANGEVEVFYRFALETAWQRMSDPAKRFLRYMAQADAGVRFDELQGVFQFTLAESREAHTQLRRWSLILSGADSARYDLHPWVRRSVRSNLEANWAMQPALDELDQIAAWKYGV